MARYTVHQVDNRDSEQMYGYLEARIEAMKRRIAELEEQNENLRMWHHSGEFESDANRATDSMPV